MASHGVVPDLFDDRYLQLQDVAGNVEPFPIPVPHEDYEQYITVYAIGIPLDIFTALIQDFTDRYSMETGEELWSWLVQWKVDKSEDGDRSLAFKRPRLWTDRLTVPPAPSASSPSPRLQREDKKFYKPLGRRRFDPELAKYEEVLRVLLDIFQAEPNKVPSIIEILYEFLDYYEGDGYALKCAMQKEIPNLWAFERPPVVLPHGHPKTHNNAVRDPVPGEDDEEFSERRQYGEKRFGLQAPKVDLPMSVVINMPPAGDHLARTRYHAACFKSRELALSLLKEAGMSERQIDNYVVGQKDHPMDTPEDGLGGGFKHYRTDKWFHRELLEMRGQVTKLDKSVEALMNARLDYQAQQAAHRAEVEAMDLNTATEGSSSTLQVPAPLIPHTASSAFRGNTHSISPRRNNEAFEFPEAVDPITEVPGELAPYLKSRLFSAAVSQLNVRTEEDVDGDDEMSEDEEGYADGDTSFGGSSDPMDVTPHTSVTAISPTTATLASASNSNLATYLQQLTPAQAARLAPSLLNHLRLVLARHQAARAAAQAQARDSVGTSAGISPAGTHVGPSHAGVASLPPAQAASSAAVADIAPLAAPTNAMLQISALMQPVAANTGAQGPQLLPPVVMANNPGITVTAPPTLRAQGPFPTVSQQQSLQHNSLPATQVHQHHQQRSAVSPIPNHSLLTPGLQGLSFSGTPSGSLSPTATPNRPHLTPGLRGPSANSAAANSFTSPVIATTPSPSTAAGPSSQNLPLPPPPSIGFPPPRPGIQRGSLPSPLRTSSTMATSSGRAHACSIIHPYRVRSPESSQPRTICIHFPSILLPRNTLPGGEDGDQDNDAMDTDRPKDNSGERTDALMLGIEDMNTGTIELSRAIFLSANIGSIFRRKMIDGSYQLIERYIPRFGCPPRTYTSKGKGKAPMPRGHSGHGSAYDKLMQALSFMYQHAGSTDREELLSKRWRVSPGMMAETDRGAVWEGWAVVLDRPIEMTSEERDRGALKVRPLNLDAQRMKEIEEMLEDY
ncbi:uncharacterized protein EI97DRAFT_78828 [Westerdykella ornata]|uniref:Uncharacterized protein n=1 Tax=Westerdykella ornata TaxID=318751 RepID=A0A6A6JEW5_WESOR|nr:uncharacterized protein EI97DRAFT_78828 [Westerdykella ornata]KAF2275160.1 hypothetical protein EI97DRAFT_78828 [Westerdykella ornata]